MSEKHLVTGDALPPLKDGELHIFTMKYCPYTERIKLILAAKGVQYQVINCSMVKKPEFLLERSPEGKVPVIEKDGKILYESEIICNLLEEWYPDVPLYPKDPYLKAKDQVVISMYSNKVIPVFYKILTGKAKSSVDPEALPLLSKNIAAHMKELKSRGTVFFSGNDAPGMVDFFCWPWIERMFVFDDTKEIIDSNADLKKYADEMKATKVVQEVLIAPEKYREFFATYRSGSPNYDV